MAERLVVSWTANWSRFRLASASAGVVMMIVGCDSPIAPAHLAAEPPELEVLEVLPVWMRDNGIFYIHASPMEHAYRLPVGEYLVATVSSTAGEFEELRLRRQLCGPEGSQQRVCGMFIITLRPGYDLRAFEGEVIAAQARLTLISTSSNYRFGSGYAFGDWTATTNRLRTKPGVESIESYFFLSSGTVTGYAPKSAWVAGALPYRVGDARPDDGKVSARAGDTLRVTYYQPTAGTIETRLVVP